MLVSQCAGIPVIQQPSFKGELGCGVAIRGGVWATVWGSNTHILPLHPSFPVLGRLKAFKAALLEVFQEAHAQSVGMNRLTESINRDKEEPFSSSEIQAALSRMQDDNQVMVSEGIVFLI